MAKIDEKKLNMYADKLYRDELAKYKEGLEEDDMFSLNAFFYEEEKIKRIPFTKSQEKEVLDKYKYKCVVCSKPYDRDDFEIHHIDGDRSNTVTKNLIPLCIRCHRKTTRKAKARLQDYIVKTEREEEEGDYGLPDIDIPEVDIPKVEW